MDYGKKIEHYIKPMLATATDKPFTNKEWLFELKLDGYRAIAEIKKKKSLLYSRNGLSLAEKYPAISTAINKIKREAILDGEIVLLNEEGRPDFQRLQNYEENQNYPIVYYVFDILSFMQRNLEQVSLIERKKLLKKLLKKTYPIVYCDHIETKGKELFEKIRKDDLEGIIAKRKESFYTRGVRTREWLKIKNYKSHEAIIIGFTQPKRSRLHFGSILLAQYNNKKLVYIGHAGTGFNYKTLTDLANKMKPLITNRSPVGIPVKTNGPVTWLKPKLVCEISYSEITQNGILRHPVFKGLRPEKKSITIKQETERPIPLKKILKSSKQRA